MKKPMIGSPLEAVKNLTDAWLRKDAAGMSHWLTDDITETGPAFRTALSGKKRFFAAYRTYLNGSLEIPSYKILGPKTIMLSSSLAMVYFCYRMRTRTGGKMEDSQGKESMLCQRTGGAWRISFIHWHRDP